MKKVLTVCTILGVLIGLTVLAVPKTPHSPTLPATVLAPSAPASDVKAEIESLIADIKAAKEAGQSPNPAWYARLSELQPRPQISPLDQGNDACPGTVIPGIPFTDLGTTEGMTDDYSSLLCGIGAGPDVVYEYTAQTTGGHTISLCGSTFDTGLHVWTGGSCPGTTEIGCNDDYCGLSSQVTVNLTLGETYYIVVDACCGGFGNYVLNVTGPMPSQPGDVCESALPLPVPGTVSGFTTEFNNDYDAVCPYTGGTAPDVVYTFTPIETEIISLSLCGVGSLTNYDTKLYVFENTCGNVFQCNDDACHTDYYMWDYVSRLDCFPVAAGNTYYVVVDGYGSSSGEYTLEASVCQSCDPPANDDCANALPIAVNGEQVCATTECATLDCAPNGIPEIWYSFDLTECMDVAVAYCGTTTGGNILADLFLGSCCGTVIGFTTYEYTSCADGFITVHFSDLQPGSYWLPVGFAPAGPFCVQVLGTPCPPPPVCEFCNAPNSHTADPDPDAPILDYATTDVILNVPIEYHITDVNATVDLDHTYIGDIELNLTSPAGTTVSLFYHSCGGAQNMFCTKFDDEAAGPINCADAPFFQMSFQPYSALSAFDGENAFGNWTLSIFDWAGGDVGSLHWFCLTFEYDEILAVDLGAFDAIAGDRSVELRWTTASETNNDYFDILRDGEMAGRVDATNNATGSSYSWTDRSVTNGTTYTYTLVGVDINGAREELATESVTPSFGTAVITEYALHQNYPNPFNPETQITYDLVDNGFVSLKVYNLMGQEVAVLLSGAREAGRHTVSFDASRLPSGIYVYTLTANGFTAQKKMLLVK